MTHIKTSFGTIIRYQQYSHWLDARPDEGVEIVVSHFAQGPHLFHDVPADVLLFREFQFLYAHHCPTIRSCLSEHLPAIARLVRYGTHQTQLREIESRVITHTL